MSSLDNYLLVVLLVVAWSQSTHQHGRLIEPPARNSMWRIGYNTTPNYEDSELFCGGIVVCNISIIIRLFLVIMRFFKEPMVNKQR